MEADTPLQQNVQEEGKVQESHEDVPDVNAETRHYNDLHSGGCNSDSEKEEENEDDKFEIDQNVPMHEQFPMRKTFQFDNLIISSDFDAGNMRSCKNVERIIADPDDIPHLTEESKYKQFDIWIS